MCPFSSTTQPTLRPPDPPKSGFRSEGIAWNLLGDLTREPANGATRRPEAKGGDTDTWDAGVLGLPGADGFSPRRQPWRFCAHPRWFLRHLLPSTLHLKIPPGQEQCALKSHEGLPAPWVVVPWPERVASCTIIDSRIILVPACCIQMAPTIHFGGGKPKDGTESRMIVFVSNEGKFCDSVSHTHTLRSSSIVFQNRKVHNYYCHG